MMFTVSTLLERGVSQSVAPFLAMTTQMAATAATPGLQLDSKDEVAAALKPFTDTPQVTFVHVRKANGTDVMLHRKQGFAQLPAGAQLDGEVDGELFRSGTIAAGGATLGKLTLGMSLSARDGAVSSARQALMVIGFICVLLMALSMRLLLRLKLERPLQTA